MQPSSDGHRPLHEKGAVFFCLFWLILCWGDWLGRSQAWAQEPVVRNHIGMELVLIPAGEFEMGSPPDEIGRDPDEGKLHRVRISRPFYAGRYEVTQGQWEAVMGNNPSWFRDCSKDCPVEQVNWWEALTFANALSRMEKLEQCYELKGCQRRAGANEDMVCESARFKGLTCRGYRLPTEAEWEYAARAGTRTPIYSGLYTLKGENFSPELDLIAWYAGNSGVIYEGGYDCSTWKGRQHESDRCGTQPVGRKKPNRFRLYDILGNVYEWVWDWYNDKYYQRSPAVDPLGPSTGFSRVYRGGSWRSLPRYCRTADRNWDEPDHRFDVGLGFRLVKTAR